MKKKHLLLGALLVGTGVVLSSPLFRSRVETDLRNRVEESLKDSANNRFQDVRVADVDHMDVALDGQVPTAEDRNAVGPYIQREVPGVGRISTGKVTVQARVNSAETITPSSETQKDTSTNSEEVPLALSSTAPASPVAQPSEAEVLPITADDANTLTESMEDDGKLRNAPVETADTPSLEPAEPDAATISLTEQQAATDSPSTDDPFESPAPPLPCRVSINRDDKTLYLDGVVDTEETKQQLTETVRQTFPDSEIKNSLSVNSEVMPTSWTETVGPLLSALRNANTKDLRVEMATNEISISGEVPDQESFRLVGDIAANVFGEIANTSELSVSEQTSTEPEVNESAEQTEPHIDSTPATSAEQLPGKAPTITESNTAQEPLAQEPPTQEPIVNSVPKPPRLQASPSAELPGVVTEKKPSHAIERLTKPSPIEMIGDLLSNRTIVLGDASHLKDFAYNQGAKPLCLPSPTSTFTSPSSSASSAYSAEPLVLTPGGYSGVTAVTVPNNCKPKTNCCESKSNRPNALPSKSRRCLRSRRQIGVTTTNRKDNP